VSTRAARTEPLADRGGRPRRVEIGTDQALFAAVIGDVIDRVRRGAMEREDARAVVALGEQWLVAVGLIVPKAGRAHANVKRGRAAGTRAPQAAAAGGASQGPKPLSYEQELQQQLGRRAS
jgi:hypothetical protein